LGLLWSHCHRSIVTLRLLFFTVTHRRDTSLDKHPPSPTRLLVDLITHFRLRNCNPTPKQKTRPPTTRPYDPALVLAARARLAGSLLPAQLHTQVAHKDTAAPTCHSPPACARAYWYRRYRPSRIPRARPPIVLWCVIAATDRRPTPAHPRVIIVASPAARPVSTRDAFTPVLGSSTSRPWPCLRRRGGAGRSRTSAGSWAS
jgi:hypothetical protein